MFKGEQRSVAAGSGGLVLWWAFSVVVASLNCHPQRAPLKESQAIVPCSTCMRIITNSSSLECPYSSLIYSGAQFLVHNLKLFSGPYLYISTIEFNMRRFFKGYPWANSNVGDWFSLSLNEKLMQECLL